MTMSHSIVFSALAAVLLSPAAVAETAIGSLRQQAPGIQISGVVTHVFGNSIVVQDETGSVLVDTGPEWFKRHAFAEGEPLTVVGEMDDGSFDAFSIERADHTRIEIRPADGPPPWSGGRK
jgi:hypothetical protein